MRKKMDVSNENTISRANRIHSVEIALREINDKGRLLDYDKFWIEISNKFEITERLAKEYIKIAKARIDGWMKRDVWGARADEDKIDLDLIKFKKEKKELEEEENYNKRVLIVLNNLEKEGLDTSKFKARIKAEKEGI